MNDQLANKSSRQYVQSYDLLSSKFIKREIVLSNDNSNLVKQKSSLSNTFANKKTSKHFSEGKTTPKLSEQPSDSITGIISSKSKPIKNQIVITKKLLNTGNNRDIENVH